MPRQKTTRQMILDEGYRLAIEEGMDQVQVKIIAKNLGCSVQPVYSYFKNMEDLKNEIVQRAFQQFMTSVLASISSKEDYMLQLGHAFIVQAYANQRLFEYFAQGLKSTVQTFYDLFDEKTIQKIAREKQIAPFQARNLLNHFLVYTMGLCQIVNTAQLDLQEVLNQLAMALEAFEAQTK